MVGSENTLNHFKAAFNGYPAQKEYEYQLYRNKN